MSGLLDRFVVLAASAMLASSSGFAQTSPQDKVPISVNWLGNNAPTRATVRLGASSTPLTCTAATRSCSGNLQVPAGRPTINILAISFGDDDFVLPIRLVQGQRNASFDLRYRTVPNCHISNVNYAAERADVGNVTQALEKWFVAFRLLKLSGGEACDTLQKVRVAKAVADRSVQLVDFSKGFFAFGPGAQMAFPDLEGTNPFALPGQGPVLATYANLLDPSEIRFLSENQRLATDSGDYTAAEMLLKLNRSAFATSPEKQRDFERVGLSEERFERQSRELDRLDARANPD